VQGRDASMEVEHPSFDICFRLPRLK